jgi:hypothetical protein
MLIELHHGEIGAYDNDEGGATFFIKLPTTLTPSEKTCKPKAYLNELMGDSEPSGEETVEADTTTLSVIEVPKNIDMTLSADFKKILFQKMELDNVTGKLIVASVYGKALSSKVRVGLRCASSNNICIGMALPATIDAAVTSAP